MNKLLTMRQCAVLIGMAGKENRWVVARLRAIQEQRPEIQFTLVKTGRQWVTTEADIRRLLPELFRHDAVDEDNMRSLIDRMAIEIRKLSMRVTALENERWAERHAATPRRAA